MSQLNCVFDTETTGFQLFIAMTRASRTSSTSAPFSTRRPAIWSTRSSPWYNQLAG